MDLTGIGAGFFALFNRGKRSIQLDTGTAHGREALHKLLARADVFVENFRDASLVLGAIPQFGLFNRL